MIRFIQLAFEAFEAFLDRHCAIVPLSPPYSVRDSARRHDLLAGAFGHEPVRKEFHRNGLLIAPPSEARVYAVVLVIEEWWHRFIMFGVGHGFIIEKEEGGWIRDCRFGSRR